MYSHSPELFVGPMFVFDLRTSQKKNILKTKIDRKNIEMFNEIIYSEILYLSVGSFCASFSAHT